MQVTQSNQNSVQPSAAALDLYRDVHKGIRSELFTVTETAGRIDPADIADRAMLAGHVRGLISILESHAAHEDSAIQPVLQTRLPALAETIATQHEATEARIVELADLAASAEQEPAHMSRAASHRLYLELASFTSDYLAHQDVEEQVVMPALEQAIGPDAVVEIHTRIVSNIPPDEMARFMAVMIPAMNVDDRTEMLGGMRETAPAEAFEGIWSLTGSVLSPLDHAAVAARLGIG